MPMRHEIAGEGQGDPERLIRLRRLPVSVAVGSSPAGTADPSRRRDVQATTS